MNFTDTSQGNPTTWRWELGDGQTTTGRNPVYTYAKPGTYPVRLTVTNSSGDDTHTETAFITVGPPKVIADFAGMPTSGTAPLNPFA